MRLWEVDTGANTHTLTGSSVAFSPDGNTLASATTVRLWEVDTGTNTHTLTGHTGWVVSVAFSPDGASASEDGTVRRGHGDKHPLTH